MMRVLTAAIALGVTGPQTPHGLAAQEPDAEVIDRFWSAAARGDSAGVLAAVTPRAELFEYHGGHDAFVPMDWFEFPLEYLDQTWGFPSSDFSVAPVSAASNGPFVSRQESVRFVRGDGLVEESDRLATYLVRGGRIARIWLFPGHGEPTDFGIEPRFAPGVRPTLLMDAAHANLHKSDGSFSDLAALAAQDGLIVRDLLGSLSAEELSDADLFVSANPLRHYSADEMALLERWVRSGGALLLVSDHPPYADYSAPLARRLGFDPFLGRAIERPRSLPDLFGSAMNGLRLPDGSIPSGLTVATMTGHAFMAPDGAVPLLTLEGDWIGVTDDGEERSLEGWLQGAALSLGLGRVVFLSEARVLADLSLHDNAAFAHEILKWLIQ
ncbi:MAG: DUF4350 domain-containing protein [Longimicrobiales bacterium]|nr:DUF4350 domain-containing protein [Longimicrobiales bacterium]